MSYVTQERVPKPPIIGTAMLRSLLSEPAASGTARITELRSRRCG
jgi:hypothetical protein